MASRRSGLGGRAIADRRLAGDQHRPVGALGGRQAGGDFARIVAVAGRHGPSARREARRLVGRIGQRHLAVDGDAVVVPQHDEVPELQVTGQRDRLLADAFHQAAVAGQHIGLVADEAIAEFGIEVAFGNGEAHRVGDALAQRPGRRLDAGGVAELGVAGGLRTHLAEVPDVIQRHVGIAGQVQQRIQQHRAVASREDEAVAVRPVRVGRVELQELGEQHGCNVGGAHRQARMAGIGLLHRVHGKGADGIGHVAGLFGGIMGHARLVLWMERSKMGRGDSALASQVNWNHGVWRACGPPIRGGCVSRSFSLCCATVIRGKFCNLTRGFDVGHSETG